VITSRSCKDLRCNGECVSDASADGRKDLPASSRWVGAWRAGAWFIEQSLKQSALKAPAPLTHGPPCDAQLLRNLSICHHRNVRAESRSCANGRVARVNECKFTTNDGWPRVSLLRPGVPPNPEPSNELLTKMAPIACRLARHQADVNRARRSLA
jgi:hypothetical protein